MSRASVGGLSLDDVEPINISILFFIGKRFDFFVFCSNGV